MHDKFPPVEAAEAGHPAAAFNMGVQYLEAGEEQLARSSVMCILLVCSRTALLQAAKYFQVAAERGMVRVQHYAQRLWIH
jgi:TPR repeat protein